MELYTMSQHEISRLEVIQKVILREIKQASAADLLEISIRQVQRLVSNYRLHGTLGLISKKRNKPSNHQLASKIKDEAISIIGSKYVDFGPTLAWEKLVEIHGINISIETVRKLMIKAGFWIPRNKIIKRVYQPRNRRNCYGELIQIDGSLHNWFEDRNGKCCLLVFIDDATSKLMTLYFTPSESMHTYFLATKQYLENYGKPIAFYSDKLSVFRVNHQSSQDKIMSQFCRGLYELNIDLIYANSPQAKGRVERANKTLQDRLVKELRLRNISDIDTANQYIPEFMEEYNKRFAKSPINSFNAHRELQPHESIDHALCFKQPRTVTNNLTVQHDRVMYLIEDTEQKRGLKRQKIELYEYPDGSIELYHGNRQLSFSKLYDRVIQEVQGDIIPNKRIEDTLAAIKEIQQLRSIKKMKRSTSVPTKRHLGIIPPQVNDLSKSKLILGSGIL